ncbi:sigma-E processing peptidase SpoIIGA [Bacillus glycinifermentans]|uniref:Sporulation sigma-E factor-processing peptidase n=1 Tax=Bacillus glycinifermentans TaxID=1664069 RepID=A0A0T6BP06_9BACI|nr:sigma-E processing peptidase SpoIIGA [Bacillus glycinifermentans]ATH91337.1 sigma-E processing peptidase SpoIIGA [Bacillus glycinifermentans]KRT93383.1 sigma-E processing peptidase SpoIIGA [Bacillus glycinifermentans]MEC0485357.1 sigma-E processing peptidase SpoIIGA [Bacillus glycinifermentans]
MEVYLDAIWLLNFCFDLLLLLLTAFMLKRRVKKRRLILGALIASSIVLFMFTPFSPYVLHPAGKLSFSIVIVLSTFGFKRFRFFLQHLFSFYFVTFLMGGGIIGVHSLMETDSIMENGVFMTNWSGFGDPVSWLFVAAGFPAVWLFSKKRFEDVEAKKIQYDERVLLEVDVEGHTLHFHGLIDSGNQLYDPITKTPVMIVNIGKLKSMLGEDASAVIMKNSPLDAVGLLDDRFPHIGRIRLIPYRGVGHQHQFLLCVKPDRVLIYTKKEVLEAPKCLIGINTSPLSADDEFDAIVHPKMMSGHPVKRVS